MKRLPLLVFTLVLMSLSACGNSAPEQSAKNDGAAVVQSTATTDAGGDASAPAEPEDNGLPFAPTDDETDISYLNVFGRAWTGDLDAMEENRVIRVLTVYSPGRYYLEDIGAE